MKETKTIDKIYENTRRKSVKPYVKITYKGETIKLSKKKLKKLTLKSALVTISLIALFKMAPTTYDKINYALDVKNIATEYSMEANSLLVENNLHVVPQEDGYWGNDYYKIPNLSEKDLYGFVKYCGYEEAENIVKALGYESWDNFLSMKGYFDKNGNPSIAVWENYEEARLVNLKEGEKKK